MRPRLILLAASLALAGIADGTFAQDKGTLDPVAAAAARPSQRIPRLQRSNCLDGKWCLRLWPPEP